MFSHSTQPEPVQDSKAESGNSRLGLEWLFWSKCSVISTQINYINVDDSFLFHISLEKISIQILIYRPALVDLQQGNRVDPQQGNRVYPQQGNRVYPQPPDRVVPQQPDRVDAQQRNRNQYNMQT